MKSISIIFLVFFIGCSSIGHQIKVDSVSEGIMDSKKYVILSGAKDVSGEDLRFREFKTKTSKILNELGFVEVESEKKAELAILLSYGVGDGVTHTEITSTGMWDYYPSMRGRRNYYPFGYRQYHSRSEQVTTYDIQIILDAFDTKTKKQIWETKITSKSRSDDLRSLFPYMIQGAKPYIGKNTGKQIRLTVKEEDLK